MGIDLLHVHAADFHRTGGSVPEPGNEAGSGGLAAAGWADQRHGLPRLRCEGNVGEGRSFRTVIGEAHVLEFHPVAMGRFRMRRCFQSRSVHHLVDAAKGSVSQHCPGGGEHNTGKRRGDDGRKHRIENKICDEPGEIPAGQRAGGKEQNDWNQEDKGALRKGQIDRLRHPAHLVLVVSGLAAVILNGLLERLEGINRLLEDFHHGNAPDILGARLGHAVLC